MKSLIYFLLKNKGRNNHGHITVRHKGGGNKKLYRSINYSYCNLKVTKRIIAFEYNPYRATKIALLKNSINRYEYITAEKFANISSIIEVGPNFKSSIGFSKPLWNISLGASIFNLEILPKKGAQIARSSGTSCNLVGFHKSFAIVRFPSKELKLIKKTCFATLGIVKNSLNYLKKYKKAGQVRWKGIRPSVRGVAMNPIDHPHGGGEGKCPVGHPSSMSPWGKPTRGVKTRRLPNKFTVSKKKK